MTKFILLISFIYTGFIGIKAQSTASLSIFTEENNFEVLMDNKKQNVVFYEEEGFYSINGIPLGKHTFSFKKKHFETLSENINFTNAESQIIDLPRLEPKSDFILESVIVKGGQYTIGDKGFGPTCKPHKVKVNTFMITKYEITYEDFIVFMNKNELSSDGSFRGTPYLSGGTPIVFNDQQEFVFQANELCNSVKDAITNITYEGAKAFAEWAGGRLPTEAEWEYAARGGKKKSKYIYSGSNNIDMVSWNQFNSDSLIHEVGKLKANVLGIYDMSGNAAEWCSDWYSESYYMNNIYDNPQGPETGNQKVVRGGSFISDVSQHRVAARDYYSSESGAVDIGFRIVFEPVFY